MSEEKPAEKMVIVARGEVDGVEWVTAEAPLYGAVNGYVRVPDDHPWHGKDYDEINVRVHGGLTYANGDWIGFDCLHLGDWWPEQLYGRDFRDIEWTPEMVALEAQHLARETAAYTR